jgi:hypothetical protein
MSHVDEGQLEALLDGAYDPGGPDTVAIEAHLSTCPDCRTRLDEARALKERAAAVLRAARPRDVPMPSFEQMIASRRAAATVPPEGASPQTATVAPVASAPSIRRAPIHRLPLAWAATLVLAVAGGWMARELLREGSAGPIRVEMVRDNSMAVPSPESEVKEEAGAMQQDASADSRSIVVPARPETPAERRAFADEDQAKKVEASDLSRQKAQAAAPPATDAVAGAPPPAISAAGRAEPEAANRLRAAGVRAAEENLVMLDIVSTGSAAPEAVATLVGDYAAATDSSRWATVSVAEAAARLGRPPLTIPGLEVESVQVAGEAGTLIVRLTQRIDATTAVELIERRELVANEALASRASAASGRADAPARLDATVPLDGSVAALFRGRTLVSTSRPGFVLILGAALPADSLRALSERVR